MKGGILSVLFGLCALATFSPAQTYQVLYSFAGGRDGGGPSSSLLRVGGVLYGTTGLGGASDNGTLYKLTAQGQETVLHSFTGTDGRGPGELVRDSAGNFFGAAGAGGPVAACKDPFLTHGCGVVFEYTTAGKLKVLFRFSGDNGAVPSGKLVFDAKGNLYGGTAAGGSNPSCMGQRYRDGCGTVFQLNPVNGTWTETVLYNFAGGADSYQPSGIIRYKGNLFGTTAAGDGLPCDQGVCGTVFEVAHGAAGWTKTTLHSFSGAGDGAIPTDAVIADSDGNLYGTTYWGGEPGLGTIFKIDGTGQKTVLYSFTGPDGAYPGGALTRDKDGNLYGTTSQGGTSKVGTVFKLDPSNHLTVLHHFTGGNDGAFPYNALLLNGNFLYGTTAGGGSSNWGTVFKVEK